jgi:Right handed beta helix region
MTKTAVLLALVVTVLASIPAHAQQRVFVSGYGLDTNPCTVTQPCRTFQQAYNTAAANGEIDVIDPAGYGPLTITKGISIQAHGFGGITSTASCNTCAAITIAVTTGDPVTLNGLLLDGAGVGGEGIYIASGQSVQVLNSVVRHFQSGIYDATSTTGSSLSIEDTVSSEHSNAGILVSPNGGTVKTTLNRITANKNFIGVFTGGSTDTTIANSVMSNNSNSGLNSNDLTWLAKNVISGNGIGVAVGLRVNSYGDNYIQDNGPGGQPHARHDAVT